VSGITQDTGALSRGGQIASADHSVGGLEKKGPPLFVTLLRRGSLFSGAIQRGLYGGKGKEIQGDAFGLCPAGGDRPVDACG
jgi:hypothetical protein